MTGTALIAVDVQNDFLPGGSLGVPDGASVVAPLLRLASRFELVVATRDFHPRDHISFVERGGPWPVHCVAGTAGSRLHPEIDRLARLVVSKGTERDIEAYSGFDGTGLAEILKSLDISDLVIGGLATDYCVRATALAALQAGFATTVAADAVRAVDVHAGDGERAMSEMRAAGAVMTSTEALAGTAQA